ncbi:hypothetical protein ATK17_3942 [Branchiibius hedensis]|uniref:Uncharacterized protein n=1 Tax=Branchiibius hedensis TaxID=672460 RepID=A0A2Y9CAX4_9MICO|nr:hypothetical protein [Branchiibius hedensis]PWJ23000.1 hypothetical protein ATK17_3890 [Branchiibius hedensis]PWJ23051.1 hypothetical protein ATK17_3942 [Branchiibius hedensis]SSA59076.1 hypothetical protein SAMN04489750_3890 [Branchiibius hedensis]SSA59127.1 hypothetical protein SAMN04489750_3942 [Branchiibius hedensis]
MPRTLLFIPAGVSVLLALVAIWGVPAAHLSHGSALAVGWSLTALSVVSAVMSVVLAREYLRDQR